MTLKDLRELLVLLEEFGVAEFADSDVHLKFGNRLVIEEPSATPDEPSKALQPVPVTPQTPMRVWDDPSLWPGKRLDFDGKLR